MGCISIFRLPIVLRGRLWEERGLSNRFPVSTAQSLRHHSIVCFTTQFFRHSLAARIPPLCRCLAADDAPERKYLSQALIFPLMSSAASLRSSHLVSFGSFSHPPPLASIAESRTVTPVPLYVIILYPLPFVLPTHHGFIYSPEHVFPWDPRTLLLSIVISMDLLS
jgi:hypothetical protein